MSENQSSAEAVEAQKSQVVDLYNNAELSNSVAMNQKHNMITLHNGWAI